MGVAATGLASVGSGPVAATSGDLIWTYGEELDCSQASTFEAPLTVVDGLVFAGTTCAHLHVVDAATGEQADTIYTNATVNRAPTVVGDLVVSAPNNQELMAYDMDGDERSNRIWEADVGGTVTTRVSSPTVANGTVYTTNHDGPPYLHAVDLQTGDERWTYDGAELGESPIVHDGTVYATGRDGLVVALDAESGDEAWTAPVGESVESTPTLADGMVFAGTTGGTLYAIEAESGDEAWTFDAGGHVAAPTVADGVVYVGSFDDTLYAVDAASGDEEWRFDTGAIPTGATVAGGTVFVGSGGARVFAIDAASGEQTWRFEESDIDTEPYPRATAPTVVDGVVYVATTNGLEGRVHALDAGVSGSSEDSRVVLGTSGHHDEWAEQAATSSGPTDASGGSETDDPDDGASDDTDANADGADDGMPGPGIVGAIASLTSAAYLLGRRTSRDRSK
ncbi:PQQ-binding-like beta-propeller repeat protein [Halovivax gelatinilyticus]|uniref:outer membrane protein assembly factor BamB family protein n=1 Tax=Halovivax gelatinilyticus TaxID=2961597 RepID=UPI0020CA488F|nr:PQQ-binding-like beta-propeller repeat protein [Halovivax gelatinilyticus]